VEMDRRRVARIKIQRLKQPGELQVPTSASDVNPVAENARKME